MAQTTGITLPSINGALEAGIAVGTDPSIPDDQKLNIQETGTLAEAVKYSALWALRTFGSRQARDTRFYVAGAAVLVHTGLIRRLGNAPDGDWKVGPAATDPTAVEADTINQYLSPESYRQALTIVVATKANWWLTNHHTGQGGVSGYAKKVLEVLYNGPVSAETVQMAHTLGHWASTLRVLGEAGIPELRQVENALFDNTLPFSLSADARLRFSGPPAGTHRTAVAYEGAKRLVKSPLIKLCPNPGEFVVIADAYKKIMDHRTYFHVGHAYLCERPPGANHNDSEMDGYLGRIGTFIRRITPRSTLAASPHLAQGRVESYPDFSAEWDSALNSYRSSAATNIATALQTLIQPGATISAADLTALQQNFY